MDVIAFAKTRRPLHQGNLRKLSQYFVLGLVSVLLAACHSSATNSLPEFTSAAEIPVPEGTTDTGYTAAGKNSWFPGTSNMISRTIESSSSIWQ